MSDASNSDVNEHCARLRERRPILVGTDGSSESARGVRFAADLADSLGADLVVVHALGLLTKGVDWHASTEERREWAERHLAGEWTSFIEREHGDVRTAVIDGPDAIGLLHVAEEENAAMIVVGSHGSGGSGDPFLGSTSHRIVRDSHRPVVVVPPAEDHQHSRDAPGPRDDS